MICADNTTTSQVEAIHGLFVSWSENSAKVQSLFKCAAKPNNRFLVKPEDFVWLELSMVPEVERVFVERRGNSFQVMTVVNDRNPELRLRIFAREKAIIDELAQYEFDFDILTRMDQELESLVSICDRPSYAR